MFKIIKVVANLELMRIKISFEQIDIYASIHELNKLISPDHGSFTIN